MSEDVEFMTHEDVVGAARIFFAVHRRRAEREAAARRAAEPAAQADVADRPRPTGIEA
jgi:hypothetical protein